MKIIDTLIRNKENRYLLTDILIVLVSVVVAYYISDSGLLHKLLSKTVDFKIIASFVTGIFFTTVFTVPVAIAAFAELSTNFALIPMALLGAMGAVLGDLIIFRFVKDRFSMRLISLLTLVGCGTRCQAMANLKLFRFTTFMLAGLIIASPLPDEIGVTLLGLARVKEGWFIPISLVFNFIGILLVGLAARSVL